MDAIDRMRIFSRVAELQSFTKAAETLNLPKATVSVAIQELESALGVRLLQRTTRQVSLTTEGSRYLERSQELLSDLEEAQSMFRRKPEQLKGKVRVDMAASMASGTVIPRLPAFLEKHPGLEVEISCTDQTVDLVRDGIDCAIRSGSITQPGTIERSLGEASMVNCVSPTYIKKHGKPKSLEDLINHRLIFYSQILGGRKWGFEYFDGKEYREVKMQGVITVNNTDAFRASCLAGLGIFQAPLHGVRPYLKSGDLIQVLPNLRAEPLAIKLVYTQRRLMADRVRAVMDWLEPTIKEVLSKN